MGKRKGRKEAQETQILADELGENGEEEGANGAGFFACYLLTSLCPRFKGHTYIGYTLNPRRRIRQHNGEIGSGAWRTKRKRPWEMVLCIYGFPTNIAALQFEWAWQHPVESLAVRNAATSFKSLSGLANKIKMAYTMLTLPAWQSLNLTVNLFSTKYQKYTAACPALPEQMRTQVCAMEDLPCYNVDACVNDDEWDNNEFECSFQYPKEKESTGATREVRNSPSHGVNDDEWDNNEFECSFQYPKEKESTGATREIQNSPTHGVNDDEWDNNEFECSFQHPKDQGPSFCINNSPAKTSFSFASSYVCEDLQTPRLVALNKVFDETLDRRSTSAFVADEALDRRLPTALVGDEHQTLIRSGEVEIIDIVTPSPCHRINSGSKKRRRPTLVPEIIDLTNSPMYV